MKTTVFITTWVVPFAHVVKAVQQFESDADAVRFINQEAAKWWAENEGDRCVAEGSNDGHELLAADTVLEACVTTMLWGGEVGFVPMVMAEEYAAMHQASYAQKGQPLPGYLINAYAAGHKPGGYEPDEQEEYQRQSEEGIKTVLAYYKPKH